MNTCRAADSSMPDEIREGVLAYIRKHRTELVGRYLDDEEEPWFCLLEISGGQGCGTAPAQPCRYGQGQTPTRGQGLRKHKA